MALSDPARAALREIVGADAVHNNPRRPTDLQPRRRSGARPAEAVVLPVSAEQVSALVRWASWARVCRSPAGAQAPANRRRGRGAWRAGDRVREHAAAPGSGCRRPPGAG